MESDGPAADLPIMRLTQNLDEISHKHAALYKDYKADLSIFDNFQNPRWPLVHSTFSGCYKMVPFSNQTTLDMSSRSISQYSTKLNHRPYFPRHFLHA